MTEIKCAGLVRFGQQLLLGVCVMALCGTTLFAQIESNVSQSSFQNAENKELAKKRSGDS